MPKPANYFRIGLFIIVAAVIFVAGLLIFGAGQFFKKQVMFETYVRGTVQGVDIGSPVKFRGVQIGQVTWVGFSFNTYPQEMKANNRENFVIIRMKVDREIFPNMFDENLQPILDRGVQNGLRVRIEPQGITGMNYLEINFLKDPNQFPVLAFDWRPEYYYIPSAPGELANILDSVNNMMRELEKLNLADLQGGLEQLLTNLNKAITGAEIEKLSTGLQTLMSQIDQALASAKLGPLSDEARVLMSGLQKSNDELQKVLKNIEPATRFNPEEIKAVVRNLADTTANLEQFSSSIKQRPSSLLWGSPPKPKPEPTPTPKKRRN